MQYEAEQLLPAEDRWFLERPCLEPGSFLIVGATFEQLGTLATLGHLRIVVWDSTFGAAHGLLLTSFHVVDEFGKGHVVGNALVESESTGVLKRALTALATGASGHMSSLQGAAIAFSPGVFMSDQATALLGAARCVT